MRLHNIHKQHEDSSDAQAFQESEKRFYIRLNRLKKKKKNISVVSQTGCVKYNVNLSWLTLLLLVLIIVK